MSWATPSCISRESRRRSSAVAASRNAENSRAVSRWTALGPSRRISLRIRSSTPMRAGSTPADSTPATIAVVPASVLSGKREDVVVQDGQADAQASTRDVLALVDVDRAPIALVTSGVRVSPRGTLITERQRSAGRRGPRCRIARRGRPGRGRSRGRRRCRSAGGSAPARSGRARAGRASRCRAECRKVPTRPRPRPVMLQLKRAGRLGGESPLGRRERDDHERPAAPTAPAPRRQRRGRGRR